MIPMRGRFLGFTKNGEEGVISIEDESRFTFNTSEFHGDIEFLAPGTELDFLGSDGSARDVFRVPSALSEKSKLVASLLAFFLGGAGVHKFYLGYARQGAIMLLVSLFGLIFFGLPTIVVWFIAFVEGIIYISKTDDDFYHTYVKNEKPWF
jgi:TM2 domain-containing membrane protein YozV